MTRMILLAGAAALAIAMPASAEKGGKGGGHGHGGGKGHAAQVDRGGGKGRAGKPDKAQRHAVRAEGRSAARAFDDRGRGRNFERRAERRSAARAFDDRGRGRNFERRAERRGERRAAERVRRIRDRSDDRRLFVDRRARSEPVRVRTVAPRYAGFDYGCPPGLAKKNNGCLPPGQAKKLYRTGQRVDRSWYNGYALPAGYGSLYYDTPDYYYRYDNFGNIYRVDARSNMISGLIPLVDGNFYAVGQPIPASFNSYNLPPQYRDTWYDSDDAWYRYDDNAIYQVDPQSGVIESIVALLGGGIDVGEPLPAGYDAYNLPLDYRDDYADGDDYLYRYGDGNIYQVDAKTQIVKAIVEMLV